ncbi:hypothetical protein K0M31_020504 [Melipona bicolor]|uniref:PiggyBac transposable element-derived protein domain-containing protein n=1 Tax=Melipona bicolor TaxID=60889 RepID=A0AA40G7U4_9HYME|nr:hypothetical protein K0M31_020504 [Melipona bicolor]
MFCSDIFAQMKQRGGLKRKMEEQNAPGPSDQQKPSADSDDPLCKKEKPVCESGIAESSLESPSTEFLSSTLDVVQRDKRLSIPDLETPMPSTSAGSQSLRSGTSRYQRLEHFALPGGSDKGSNVGSDVSKIDSKVDSRSRLYKDIETVCNAGESDGEEIQVADPPCRRQAVECFSDENPGQAKIPFSGLTGLRVYYPKTPIEYFRLIADDILFEDIIAGMNEFGQALKGEPSEGWHINFQPVTREEFEKFIALIFQMGQMVVPEINWYWNNCTDYYIPYFGTIMHIDRFKDILNVFHVYRHEYESANDSSGQVQPLDTFNNNMKNIYYPRKELTIKRSGISLQGRHYPEIHGEGKSKYGVKLYMLTEVKGLILKVCADVRLVSKDLNKISREEIVYELLSDFEEKGHVIYLNEMFTSYSLVKNLLEKRIHTTGELTKHTFVNLLSVVNASSAKVFEKFSSEGICVMQYNKKDISNAIFMISSEYTGIMKKVTVKRNTKKVPEIYHNYISMMDDNRKTDEFLNHYPCNYRAGVVNWAPKFAIHLFHMIMYNSYLLYNRKYHMNIFDFRQNVIYALLRINMRIEPRYHIHRN